MDTEKDPAKRIRKYLKLRAKVQAKGDLKEEAEIVNVLGELHTEIGDHEEALNLHKEELGLCQATEDSIGQAVSHRKIGECFAALCNYTKAIKHQNLHLELAKVAGNLPEQQRAFTTIGRTYLIQGEDSHHNGTYEDAKPLLHRAESAFRSSIRLTQTIQEQKLLPDKEIQEMRVRSITNLALTYHYLAIQSDKNGNHYEEQCVTLFQKAITISEKHVLTAQLHRARISLTMFYRSRSKTDLAQAHVQDALKCAKVSKNVAWQTEALPVLGDIYMFSGDCKNAKKTLKRAYRLTKSPEEKDEIREKLKAVVKIYHLTLKTDDATLTSMEKFAVHEKIADKYCDLGYFQAAVCHYKCQETMLSELPDVTEKQKASVYYSLALTSSDLNDHEAAIEYYKKELNCRTEPRELAKTWSQIALCMEKLDGPTADIGEHYKKAVKYAEESGDCKLQLKTLNLLLDLHVKSKSPSASETRHLISDLELRSGLLVAEAEEESQEIGGASDGAGTYSEVEPNMNDEEDSEEMLERELENISSDDSDNEESSRRSKSAKMNWKKKLNEKGETALHRACIDGHLKRVQLLLEQGHPVNVPDYAGWIPLHEACNHGYTEIVRMLLSHGANVNYYSTKCGGTTPAQDAATNGHVEIVDLLLQDGADANIKNSEGETLLSTLESWYERSKNELDSYEEENYWKLHDTVTKKSSSEDQRKKPQNSLFPCMMGTNLEPFNDLFDSESFSQANNRTDGGLTQEVYRNNVSQRTCNVCTDEIVTPCGKTVPNDAEKDFSFSDSQILPALTPKPRRPEANAFFELEETASSGVDEYRQALAGLGGSNSLVRHANINRLSQGRKRPSCDGTDLQQTLLLLEENYSGDDWLIDDVQEVRVSSEVASNPPKRQKKMRATGPIQTTLTKSSGWQPANVQKKAKTNSSRGIVSAFLDSDNIRNSSKRLKTTKIKDFLAAQGNFCDRMEEDGIIDLPEIAPCPDGRKKQDVSPSISSVIPSGLPSQQPQVQQNLRVRVKINGKMFLVGVPGRTKTIGWLCERSSLVYKQVTGLQPRLALYTGSSTNEEDLCLLSHDDLVCDVLQSNEHVTAKVESWEMFSLTQKYADACTELKQAILPQVMNACQQSLSTGRLEVKNLGLLSSQMKPLISSIQQQEITSLALPGNQLSDAGMTSLCESLCKQMNLTTTLCSLTTPSLTEINIRCCNLTNSELKRLTQAAKAGALENLQDMNMSDNRLGDFCCEEISEIITCCKKLRSFQVASCRFTQKLFQANYQSLKNAFQESQCLQSVDFSRNNFGSTGVELLLKCFSHQIVSLNLSRVVSVSNNSLFARHILSYLNHGNCKVQYLYMSSNQLNEDHLKFFINGLKRIKNLSLHSLDISKNLINETNEEMIENDLASIKSLMEVSTNRSHHKWKDNIKDVLNDTTIMSEEELQFGTSHQDILISI